MRQLRDCLFRGLLRCLATKLLDDVLDEYVSVDSARREYGVVLKGSLEDLTLEIDTASTEKLRAEMRAG